LEHRLVHLDDLAVGNVMQRRLCDLTGQWTVPHLFAKSQSIGGVRAVAAALRRGRLAEILAADEWAELVYAIRPDALARAAVVKEKSPLSFELRLRDSHRFAYVHRERWAAVKRHWGRHPEIEEHPTKHAFLTRPRTARKW
ncbi:Glutaredoxin, partial [Coemansia helicoidea]